MEKHIRKLLFDPVSSRTLSVIVPDFVIEIAGEEITAPARLTCESNDDSFRFTFHFMQPQPPPALAAPSRGVFGQEDQIIVRGQVEGEVLFRCRVFPPMGGITRSRGTSTMTVKASRMELPAEGTDRLTSNELTGSTAKIKDSTQKSFNAHLVFHGPKLRMYEAGTEIVTSNDFLGETTSSSLDTHVFAAKTWEGALIQKGAELHLHVRSKKEASCSVADPSNLIDRVAIAVAFTHGFQPWPVYREVRIDHRVLERWIAPKLNLPQMYIAPLSESLGATVRSNPGGSLRAIIPIIAEGLGLLPKSEQDRLGTLLWNVRSSALGDLPRSTRMLILCAAFDGLMKLIARADLGTAKTWRLASDQLNLSWEGWTEAIFELWGKHRHDLSHGRLWLPEEATPHEYFTDYPSLGCAFMTVVAAYCGYDGPILADPFAPRSATISNLKITHKTPSNPA